MDNSGKMFAGAVVVWLGVVLLNVAIFGVIAYVAYHFISKLW